MRQGPAVPALLRSRISWPRCPATVTRRSPCWIGPRSRAPSANRCTRTWSPPCGRQRDQGQAASPASRVSSAAATACPRKEFTPAMVKAVFDELAEPSAEEPLHRRHRGRRDAHCRCAYDPTFDIEPDDVQRAVFFGLGADGTVGANKNSIKIIGEETDNLRPGLLRLRLEEVRRHDHLAPALRPAADPLGVPDPAGEFRGLPPVRVPGEVRRARLRQARRRVPAQLPVTARTRSGTTCRAKCRSRSSRRN